MSNVKATSACYYARWSIWFYKLDFVQYKTIKWSHYMLAACFSESKWKAHSLCNLKLIQSLEQLTFNCPYKNNSIFRQNAWLIWNRRQVNRHRKHKLHETIIHWSLHPFKNDRNEVQIKQNKAISKINNTKIIAIKPQQLQQQTRKNIESLQHYVLHHNNVCNSYYFKR